MKGDAGTPPTLRMATDTNGSSKAQLRTMKRGHRGSGCSFMIAVETIVPSQGNRAPEWLETNIARPWAGTCSTPVASTRHQRSYRNSRSGNVASAKSSSKPHSSSRTSPRSRRMAVSSVRAGLMRPPGRAGRRRGAR